jgi:protein-S-isoprenylcysteine O-methyltransferase Ste14
MLQTISIFIYTAWIGSEILFNRLLRSGQLDMKNTDKKSLPLIWITIIIAMTAGVYASMKINFPVFPHHNTSSTGLSLIVLGILFRLYAIYSLGKYFTVDVTIRKDHQLKQEGIYGIIRHPSYLGSLVSFIGFGLVLNNWVSMAIIVVPIFAAFLNRISIEEKTLSDRFGNHWKEYSRRTKKLIPFLY